MDTVGKKVVELRIEDVLPNRFQPRIKFNEDAINELSKSIKEHGVIQPIVVRPIGDKYEIIAGERRYKASCMAELKTIPAIITDLNDKDSAEVALIENVQREDLTPIEEAISYKKILDMGYITQDALATKLGKTQSTVANKLRLLNLDDEVQEALLNEQISERHARSLLKLSDKSKQKELLNKIIAERLTVRRTDDEIDKMLNGTKAEANSTPTFVINNEQEEPKFINMPEENKDPISIPSEPEAFKFFNELIDRKNENSAQPESINIPEENEIKEEQSMNKFINMPEENKEAIGETQSARFINIPQGMDEPSEEPETSKFINVPTEEQEELKPAKLFNILEEENKPEEVKEEPKEPIFDFDNLFNNPTTTPIEQNATDNNALLEELNEIENSIKNSNSLPIEEEQPTNTQEETINIEQPSTIPTMPIDEDRDFIDGFEEEPEENELPEEKTTINEMISPVKMTELKDVIQYIRDCTNKIENSGFKIDTEEIDLENEYQITIKIEK